MDKLNNIIGTHAVDGANSPKEANRLSESDVHAFNAALLSSTAKLERTEAAAKHSRALEGKNAYRAETDRLQKNSDSKITQAAKSPAVSEGKEVEEAAPVREAPAAAPDDEAEASDSGKILQQLRDRFDALTSLAPDSLAKFREEAIKLMKDMGLGEGEMESILVQLGMGLGSKLTDEQATALMMPFKPAAPAATVTASAAFETSAPMSPQELAEQQLHAAAQAPQGAKPAQGAQDAAQAKPAPAPEQQQPLPQPQQDNTQAAAKPAPASNLALVNGFAAEGGFDGGFGGQSFSQPGGAMAAGSFGVQTASTGAPESFANYMTAAGGTSPSTTQMIALQIQRNAQAQIDTFKMQLHPADLGRLEVRLKFAHDGTMKAHLIADKADTLSLLQKDSTQLQRVLQQSGLDVDDGALSFDLRQQQQDTGQSYNGHGKPQGYSAADDDFMQTSALQAKIAVEAMGSIRQGGVNIMV